jgi:hypothetical protein
MDVTPWIAIPAAAPYAAFAGLFWFAVLIAAVIGGGFVLAWYRKHVHRRNVDAIVPFTLDALRQMRADGRITEEEHEALRRSVIAAVRSPETADVPRGGGFHFSRRQGADDITSTDRDRAAEAPFLPGREARSR